jgi:hypothetical protein
VMKIVIMGMFKYQEDVNNKMYEKVVWERDSNIIGYRWIIEGFHSLTNYSRWIVLSYA